MNEAGLSSATKKLLEAAKADVPSAGARSRIWAEMSGVVGGTVGAATTTASVVSGSASGTKLFTIGGLFGGSVTVGLATLLLTIAAPHTPQTKSVAPQAVELAGAVSPPRPAARESAATAGDAKPTQSATSRAKAPSAPAHAAKPRFAEDSLSHEASLVSEARRALAAGNPELALRAIRAARALRSHQLAPEELAVEEQAQRALGHGDEANGIDVQLRLQYPESALAR
jgi:hypothetical protein